MKRSLYLFPLMAATALSMSLAACDDKKNEDQTSGTDTTMSAPADTAAADASAGAPATGAAMTGPAGSTTAAASVTAMMAKAYSTAEGATTGTVFMSLTNGGTQPTKLVGGSTDVASGVELHESVMDPSNGTMQMRKVDGIEIQPGQTVELKPDGYHVMLTGLNKTLVEGETFNLMLRFDNGPEVSVPVSITAPTSAAGGTMSDGSMGGAAATGAAATGMTGTSTDGTSAMPSPSTDTSGMTGASGSTDSSTTSPGVGGSATGTSGMGTGTSANPAATESDSAGE